ncbi:MAG TPA: efflux transporter outer membrane subunit [Casimicrobiaceae bacterium]|nr:efflux transporter outer membrane subunit [Casimicrobiaceae bacterium]
MSLALRAGPWTLVPVAAGTVILAAGCTVGPDFHRPAAAEVADYTAQPLPAHTAAAQVRGGEAQHFLAERDLPGEWWQLFGSPAITALVKRALQANPDVRAAQAALRQAQENAFAQEGAFYPSLQASFLANREKNAVDVVSPTLTSGQALFNLYTPQLVVSYVFDPWGGNRRQSESLQAQAEAQRFQLEATYLTLTSNVVAAAVQEATLRAQIGATQEVIRIEAEQLALLQRQYELGAIAGGDVAAQEAALAQTEATLPTLQKQLAQQRDLIARLAGQFPSEEPGQRVELDELNLPQDLPLGLPSRLVEQRPDVRAAEANLHSASAQVGVAMANTLPQITLTANAGSTSTQFRQLFTSPTVFWGLAGGILQPLFDGNTLEHRKRAADAALEQAAAQYRGAVLTAFQSVADALHAIEHDARALAAATRSERKAAENLAIARKAMELGATSSLPLLMAEQTYQQALSGVAQARGNRYVDTVALFQALGGGWWNRGDNSSGEPQEQARALTVTAPGDRR